MPATTTRPLFEQIDSWLQEIDTVKTASAKNTPAKPPVKKAATKKAGPSGMGKSTHPSDDVDNNTQDEQTGARFEENSSDVKKDIPDSVDATDPKSGGTQDDKQFNIGTNQASTGEDSAVENDYKGDKDDPGTSHPADAESVGEKYSSLKLGQLLKSAEEKAHNLLADLANGIDQPAAKTVQQKAAAVKAAAPAPTPDKTTPPVKEAATAGYDASALALSTEKVAVDFIAQTIRDAEIDADLVGPFIHTYQQQRAKLAADEGGEGEDHSEDKAKKDDGGEGGALPTDDGSGAGAGAMPPMSDAGGGGGGGDVLGALGAGAGGPPGAGGDMGGGLGGAPGGAPAGPGGGGGMNQEQALQELAMALQELGISPEELAQMAQQGGGAGGAGGPPGGGMPPGGGGAPPGAGGGMPPMMPPPDAGAEGAKLASAVKRFKLAGKFKVEEAKTASQRQARDQIKGYILELVGAR